MKSFTLAEKFLLLIHHPEKSRYLITEQMRNTGLIGALLLDLAHEKKIRLEADSMWATSHQTNLSPVHQQILARIAAYGRPKKVKFWISKLSNKSRTYRHALLARLEKKGILSVEHKKFLFISYLNTYLLDQQKRYTLLQDIRAVIFEKKEIRADDAALLGLIEACKMHKVICEDKSEIKYCKARLKALVQEDAIAQGVDKVIKEIQAALIAAMVATTAASTATTAASN
ncbi:Golgi phosphoprotein 3 [Catalinimonas alkaloidigena]|uniref:GOLPH3/VPS74 family protein n=1 Tax=Catalinimonas alkaloidigena TaxID=1075417 RepID=UPI00240498C6|nr:GPP34 family phosphoprotein [Catalinimonas alkaloidigena]MDF9796112.1 Golgi phosphoprotein 3 [Catalinimonas alkaloidigena]